MFFFSEIIDHTANQIAKLSNSQSAKSVIELLGRSGGH